MDSKGGAKVKTNIQPVSVRDHLVVGKVYDFAIGFSCGVSRQSRDRVPYEPMEHVVCFVSHLRNVSRV
jgi:hypothetical protein